MSSPTAVHKSYRDVGGGTKLLKKIEKYVRKQSISLTTQPSFVYQQGFSEKDKNLRLRGKRCTIKAEIQKLFKKNVENGRLY